MYHHKVQKDHKGSIQDDIEIFVCFVVFLVVVNLIMIGFEEEPDDI